MVVAAGFGAGVFAGLALSPGWWPVWPLVALGSLACRRWTPHGATAAVALAAGGLWGAGSAAGAARACASRWRDGAGVAVLAEAWDVGEPGGRSRVRIVAPEACRATVVAVWPRGVAPPAGTAAIAGTWHGGVRRGPAWWPRRPEAGARLVVRRVRPLRQQAGFRPRLRTSAERRLVALFGWERFPLASALTLGSSDQLDPLQRRRFASAGLAHLLAISGLHVAILAAALVVGLRAAGAPPATARAAAVPTVAGYVWLLGMPPPALRAVCLILVWEAARVRQRPPVRSAVLAVTALLVAALDPWAVTEVGPWLSFTGAWGAAEGARWWAALPWPGRLRGSRLFGVGSAASVSAGATLATAPVSALAFGTVTSAAVVTNMVAVPLVGVLVPLLALALCASPLPGPLAPIAAGGAGLLADILERVASWGSDLPLGSVGVVGRVRAAAALVLAVWLWRRVALPRRRAPFRGIVGWRVVTGLAALAAVAACWPLVPHAGSGYRPGWLEIDFLSVGQGDAAIVRTPKGRWILIDGGPRTPGHDAGAAVVAPELRRRGARRIALAVVSHGDADHLGGLPAVLREFPIDLALEPGEPLGRGLYREWLAGVHRRGTRWHQARAGDSLVVDGVVFRVLFPDSAWLSRRLPPNENSVVLRVEFGAFRALFPGDAGLPMEAALRPAAGPVTVLKVAHHGSPSASGRAWLEALAPRVCVVSAGVNRHGQPAPGVLAALASAGCTVHRTDDAGSVRISSDGRVALVASRGRTEPIPNSGREIL